MSDKQNEIEHSPLMVPDSPPLLVKTDRGQVRNFVFLLLENFSMMSLTSALDVLRTANLLSTEKIVSFQLASLAGQAVEGDLGFSAVVDGSINDISFHHTEVLVICGGLRVDIQPNAELNKLLRRSDVRNLKLGSLWNGVFHLAHAGLLNGCQCAVHRDNRASFRERFHEVKLTEQPFVVADGYFSCSGGNSALDMMLAFIAEHKGKALARGICDILTVDRVSEEGEARFLYHEADGSLPKNLRDVITLMENNVEEMLSADEMGELVGITRRQIQRLFQRYFDTTPARYYLQVRLNRAHQLLTQTNLSVSDISLACGFVSYPHFSKCFRECYGYPPSRARKLEE
jgi:transcriptional regulator GlxA family with amidase domain